MAVQVGCKIYGLNPYKHSKLCSLSEVEVGGISGVAVECADIGKNTDGEGSSLGRN